MRALADLAFEIRAEWTDHPVVTIEIATPVGLVMVMDEVTEVDRTLRLQGTHVQSGVAPNEIGPHNFRLIVDVAMERMDYDEIIVEGAVRTTGAHPGRRPRPIWFTRRSDAATGANTD
jgi:hypothetical protein